MRVFGCLFGILLCTSASGSLQGPSFVQTGIRDIRSFLERCPTNDPAYALVRSDFELRLDGVVITSPIQCTEPISALPIEQFTDQLIAVQVLRTAYYMGMGTAGILPWTTHG